MPFERLWRYAVVCENYRDCGSSTGVEVPADSLPIPAEAARREARRQGYKIVSRGDRRGWLVYCPRCR